MGRKGTTSNQHPQQPERRVSGWDRYDKIMEGGGAALVLLLLSLAAIWLGVKCIGWGMDDASEWSGRPQETVEASLVDVEVRKDLDSPSGYQYTGVYRWEYQGSSGSLRDDHEYEQQGLVPQDIDAHIYLDENDTWHLMQVGTSGSGVSDLGFLLLGGIVLVLGGILVARFCIGELKDSIRQRLTHAA